MQSYDYVNREGVEDITWERFVELTENLSETLSSMQIDTVVGIARAGLIPATAIACALRKEMFPVRLTRREHDTVVFDHPVWKVDVSEEVAGKVVVVVDEIADTGETLALVANRVQELGAAQVVTASLISHSWANPAPDYIAMTSDALVIFPWDKHVCVDGKWELHPEIAEALRQQSRNL